MFRRVAKWLRHRLLTPTPQVQILPRLPIYQRDPSLREFNFERDVIWGAKKINPEDATRLLG